MRELSDAPRRSRIAIAGGGLAGVSLAFLLDGACDVVLLEASSRLGGHAHTVEVEHGGQLYSVDLGAQLFSPRLQPRFCELLTQLGIYDPAAPDSGGTITRDMGITLGDHGAARPRFVSPMFWQRTWPLWAPWNLPASLGFFAFARHARAFEQHGDWSITLDAFLRGVPGLSHEQRERVMLPWLAAMTGCSITQARELSARAAMAPAVRGLSERLIEPYQWSNAVIGLGGVVELLAARCTTLTVKLGAPVVGLEPLQEGVRVHTSDGPSEDVDHVVLAAPPHAIAKLFDARPELQRILRRFGYFRSRLAIHDQPTYMPADRRNWSAYTALVTGDHCEASIWYGAIRDRLPSDKTVDVFKSWCTARAEEPRGLLHEAEYLHPLQTPDAIRAQTDLEAHQGDGRVWFAGSWTTDVDLQETALVSALRVAERIRKLTRS